MTRICPGWMQLKEGRYELIPERVDIVRRILRECIGGSGTRSIASGLNSDGVQTWGVGGKKGSHWHDSYVKKILENPALVGEYTPRSPRAGGTEATSGATLVGYYPAVTDRETWLSARAAMRARATSSVRAPAGLHRNVLSGLLKCHACGGGLHYIDKGRGPKAGAPYLQCGNSLMKGGCTEKAKYNYESTESALLMTLATNAVDVRDETVDVAPFMGAVTDAQATVERLLDLVATGVTSGAAVARRIAKAEADLAIAQTALAKAEERRALAALQPLRRIHIDSAKVAIALRERPDDREYRAEVASRIRAVIKTITLSPYKLRVLLADETTVIEGVVNLSYAGVFNLAINRFSRMNPDIPGVPSRGIKLIPPRINTWEVIEESNRVDAEKDE
ncbi:hypothetical protein ANOBCDAF_03330 [Pleomorphomonas sp. T1.2MG-36]|nr:hypothetical protein ANOBCDAF_03330 [Pleomorphomonas sp. T1.2MG-36]